MEALLGFFETIPTTYRTAVLVGGFVLFWMIEGAVPLYRFAYAKGKHAALNLFFWLTTLAINFGLAFMLVKASDFTTANQFGLMYLTDLPLWIQIVGGLLLLDLISAWLIHWVEHKVRWMWKFHLIHHTDTHVDVTTGLRHHPGESVFRAAFTALAILIIGTPVGVVLLYQTLSAFFAQLTHANIRVPERLDRALSWVLVTPNMHKIHHHYTQPLTDTNFGNIFSIWDRLFGTYVRVDAAELTYGIDTHMERHEHSAMSNLLAIPFQPYRPPSGAKFGSADLPEDTGKANDSQTPSEAP